jgi:hypothetical protein
MKTELVSEIVIILFILYEAVFKFKPKFCSNNGTNAIEYAPDT